MKKKDKENFILEDSYKLFFNKSGTAIAIVDSDTRIITANKECEILSGYSRKELENKKWVDIIVPEELPRLLQYNKLRSSQPGKIPVQYETKCRDKKGNIKHVLVNVAVIPDTEKRIISLIDITKQNNIETELKDKTHFLNNIFSSFIDGISVLDTKLNILRVNPVMEQWYKHSMPLIGKKCFQAYHGKRKPCKMCPTLKTLLTGNATSEIVPKIGQNKEINGWLELYTYPLNDINTGKLKGVIEHVRDITVIKKAEESLERSERKFKELWDNAPVAYHTLNKEGIINSVNQTELNMLGYKLEEMIHKSIFDFIEPDQREDAKERFLKKIAGKEPPKSTNRLYRRKDGSELFVSVDDRLERDIHGKITGIRTTMVDISKLKSAEEGLHEGLEKLQRTMDNTMHVIAHIAEMRDPYTAGHQVRVANLACAIAKIIGLSEDDIEKIRIAGLLHDIGKINIPIEILSKPGKISAAEFDIIKLHPKIGYEVVNEMETPYPVADTVLQHHERLNGSGYPSNLTDEKILFEAKIIGVADVVEAMSSHRPYRPAIGIKVALQEIQKNIDVLYDKRVVNACMKLFSTTKFKIH